MLHTDARSSPAPKREGGAKPPVGADARPALGDGIEIVGGRRVHIANERIDRRGAPAPPPPPPRDTPRDREAGRDGAGRDRKRGSPDARERSRTPRCASLLPLHRGASPRLVSRDPKGGRGTWPEPSTEGQRQKGRRQGPRQDGEVKAIERLGLSARERGSGVLGELTFDDSGIGLWCGALASNSGVTSGRARLPLNQADSVGYFRCPYPTPADGCFRQPEKRQM